MNLHPTALAGVLVVEPSPHIDDRGAFTRIWCSEIAGSAGVGDSFPQLNISTNLRRGTLRGLHFAADPALESKVVRCTTGAVYDVVVDLRPDSPTRFHHESFELSRENGLAIYIPPGLAHGFLTLSPNTDVLYMMGALYRAQHARGIRWDDPALGIDWPFEPAVISDRDASYPDLV